MLAIRTGKLLETLAKSNKHHATTKELHLSASFNEIQKLTRLRVVDNSEIGKRAMAEGKPPRCIHVYNKTGVGKIGKCYKFD